MVSSTMEYLGNKVMKHEKNAHTCIPPVHCPEQNVTINFLALKFGKNFKHK